MDVGASLAPERLDGFYSYLIFKSLTSIGRCPMDMNIPAQKIRALQMGPKTQNDDLLENGFYDFN
jgi:hypothetical protein